MMSLGLQAESSGKYLTEHVQQLDKRRTGISLRLVCSMFSWNDGFHSGNIGREVIDTR